MSDEQHVDKLTIYTRKGRGPMNAQQRKDAKAVFVASLCKDPNVSLACDSAGISREIAYRWREKDKQFEKDWEDAVERVKNVARSSIFQRGIIGWLEPMVSSGQVVCEEELLLDQDGDPIFDKRGKPIMVKGAPKMIRKYSDSLAALYAKSNLPEYKEKPQVNVHAQLADLAQKAKDDLLADLAAAVDDENKESPNQS